MNTKRRLKAAGLLREEQVRIVIPQARPERALSSTEPRIFDTPVLSVVTGTYNRRASLVRAVSSVRTSIRSDTPYEIIVVDGGSTDGSQEWCRGQPDIVWLDGDLSGAVANFNAGFASAKGRYVCMANDDVEFVGDSLQLALDFMPSHPRVGAACIAQARPSGEEPWVRLMDVSLDGIIKRWPMAQVAIVPRWLGDELGWWGQDTAHYHGDQLLSRRIWESGFTVSIVPDAWLRDFRLRDELRKRNDKINRGKKDRAAYKRAYPAIPKVGAAPSLDLPFEAKSLDRPDVDIVMGTYNRRDHLQRCIASFRQASEGLTHRFIVVDGGSTDGTLEWLRQQADVMLVESGVLDGAVRAFNRGFAGATADYVVNANDDMTIEGGLGEVRDYLEGHPAVGQVAFPKGEGGDFTTHDCMGKLFANFGMTRRWLGDYVGWWGNWTYKYFGDVHCSLKLWELGYVVEVFAGCRCTDYLVEDDLRGPRGGDHQCEQDSKMFERAWPTRAGKKSYVRVPVKPLVKKADFE